MFVIVMGLAAVFSDPEAVGEEGQVSVRRDELRATRDSAQNGHAP